MPRAAPLDVVGSLIPVIPTTGREFARDQRAGAFVRIYEGGRQPPVPVDVQVRVRNQRDEVVAERTDAIDAARFGPTRAADYAYELPLSTLEPGPHLLTITARTAQPTPVRADVRFSVR